MIQIFTPCVHFLIQTKRSHAEARSSWPGGAATKKASLFGGLMVVDEAIFFPEQRRHEWVYHETPQKRPWSAQWV
jgi:hypothetical protein